LTLGAINPKPREYKKTTKNGKKKIVFFVALLEWIL
jgi:hypothetical protein